MGAVWSCLPGTYDVLIKLIDSDRPFDLSDYVDVREIKRPPSGSRASALIGRSFRSEH